MVEKRNWFDQGGQSYAQFRPAYPEALAAFFAAAAPATGLAVDVGCGNGQLTTLLARHFAQVVGVDPSADQIAHAKPASGVAYAVARAEKLPLADGVASAVTAAQAAHWFDLPTFYAEVRRIARPGAVVALISYGVLVLEGALGARFQRFYSAEIGPFWPPERKLVDTGYAGIDFPFAECPQPELALEQSWNLGQFLGYVGTWSAVKKVRQLGQEARLAVFADDVAALWGDPSGQRRVAWPLHMRLGRVEVKKPSSPLLVSAGSS